MEQKAGPNEENVKKTKTSALIDSAEHGSVLFAKKTLLPVFQSGKQVGDYLFYTLAEVLTWRRVGESQTLMQVFRS